LLAQAIAASFPAGIAVQALLRATAARAQSANVSRDLFDIEPAGKNAYLALAKPAAMLNCNSTIFVDADHIIIVDSHSKPSAAAALVGQIRRQVSSKPVRYLVNTHFHYDHAQGNAAYRKLKGKVDVVASIETRHLIEERGAKGVASGIEQMKRRAEEAKEKLSMARSAEDKAFYQRAALECEAFVREMTGYEPELPDITFDRELVLHGKRLDVHLVFRGRAHTASDICAYCPQEKVLSTGDLIVGFLPGMGDGFPSEWPATLEEMGKLPFERILPGHGTMQAGRSRLDQMRIYIEELNSVVERARKAGQSLEETLRAVGPDSLRSLRESDYGQFVMNTEARFRFRAPRSDPRDLLVNGLRANITAIYQKLS